MTTQFQAPDWAGETVAILGNGPAMSHELVASVRADRVIVCNRAVRFAPHADLFVALDPEHHVDLDFDGLRVVGVECDADAMYAGLLYERVEMGVGDTIEIRNNLLAAIRIAAATGAARIVLYSVDTAAYEAQHDFRGVTEGLAALVAELGARGIAVEAAPAAEDLDA